MDILIAEDDALVASRLRRLLEMQEHLVRVAADGDVAWRLVNERPPDVLLTDWAMPGADGPELCRRIRERADGRYIYTILVTARGGRDDRITGLLCGADDYLTKPFDADELVARLGIARRILTMEGALHDRTRELAALTEELGRRNALLTNLVATDPLTGVWNRRHFDEVRQAETSLASRQGRPVSLTMVDIDSFKAYNDTHGHARGDDALCAVARELRLNVRSHDVVARYGGEEFVVLQPEADLPTSLEIGGRLCRAVGERAWTPSRITVSVGVATWQGDFDPSELLERADRALYRAKAAGRNRVVHDLTRPDALTPAEPAPAGGSRG